MTEVGATVHGVWQGGRGCPDLGENLRCGGLVSSGVWVRDVGYETAHWENSGWIPPQFGLQAYSMATLDMEGWWVGVSPSGGSYVGGWVAVGGNLRIPFP